jgi:hypothetical protein
MSEPTKGVKFPFVSQKEYHEGNKYFFTLCEVVVHTEGLVPLPQSIKISVKFSFLLF